MPLSTIAYPQWETQKEQRDKHRSYPDLMTGNLQRDGAAVPPTQELGTQRKVGAERPTNRKTLIKTLELKDKERIQRQLGSRLLESPTQG